jgi:taurine dioxygenase
MKAWQHFTASPLAGALGAEIDGISFANPSDASIAELRAALLEYQVLFFRDQKLTRDRQKNFARHFGALHVHPFEQPLKREGHPEIIVFRSGPDFPFVSGSWHADATFLDEPPFASILRCLVAPDFGGDTMWANMYTAYEALSDKMQRAPSDLVAIHDTGRAFAVAAYRGEKIEGENALRMVSAEHPVVLTHPETGCKALYVNSHFTSSIKGMKAAESGAILTFLFRHIETPEFSCRFRWRPNSVAMWDNRCTQHRALADNPAALRHLERVAIVARAN